MDNKNFLLAVALSVGFLMFWSLVVVPRFTPKAPVTATGTPVPALSSQVPATIDAVSSAAPLTGTETILRDPENEIVFTSQGGSVRHWRLKLRGQDVDLVYSPDDAVLPLATMPEIPYRIAVQDRTVRMQGTLPGGVRVTKTLTLSPTGYLHDFTFRFENPSSRSQDIKNWEVGWGPGLGTAETERKENNGLIRALALAKLNVHVLKDQNSTELGRWAGIDNRYFLIAFVPASARPVTVLATGAKEKTRMTLQDNLQIPARGELTLNYQLYAGPKGYTQLSTYGKGLEEAVDFGYFSSLGRLVLKILYYLHGVTGNYGWAIVLLTIFLQILMMPLTLKSLKAQMAMKTLQPQIAAIQQQFKSDPKRLNIEMMNIYKKSGTNPFGGCLPMLLQMPIFWALFTTLRNSYELRGAPFIGWIRDLSMADPYHALPIVMGSAMFLQQRMSGVSADPTQKQMMYMMPIMFTVMFFNFPAGLVLYWLTNNLLTMGVQSTFQKRLTS